MLHGSLALDTHGTRRHGSGWCVGRRSMRRVVRNDAWERKLRKVLVVELHDIFAHERVREAPHEVEWDILAAQREDALAEHRHKLALVCCRPEATGIACSVQRATCNRQRATQPQPRSRPPPTGSSHHVARLS